MYYILFVQWMKEIWDISILAILNNTSLKIHVHIYMFIIIFFWCVYGNMLHCASKDTMKKVKL